MYCGKKIIIGITGNIGTGKTTATKIFKGFGGRCILADVVGWEVLPEITDRLRKRFGDKIMNGSKIDKEKLKNLVFSKSSHRQFLDKISHPLLVKKILKRIENVKSGIVVIDAALLFDWPEIYKKADHSILVTADRKLKQKRAMAKGINKSLFRKILGSQKNDAEMAKQADFIIKNNSTLAALKKQCQNIFMEIKNDC